MASIDIRNIRKRHRAEITDITNKHRKELEVIYAECEHDFTDWEITPNPEMRYNFLGDPIYIRNCKSCGKLEEKVDKKRATSTTSTT